MAVYRYTVEIDSGDGGREESTLAFLGSALYHEFGDGYKLFTPDGKEVVFDAKAADYEHPGHDTVVAIKPKARKKAPAKKKPSKK